jgi:hypothetical protein
VTKALDKEILTVSQLLNTPGLTIPVYQRPYKWTVSNVNQLFQDMDTHQHKTAYRLGALVFHRDQAGVSTLNIVDGQQRTLTLVMMVWAIIQERWDSLLRQDLADQLDALEAPLEAFMEQQQFESKISQRNLHQNAMEIKRLICRADFTEQHIEFLLNRCEVVTFTLKEDVSEAFQFFDSQNARGRDLAPHDLLKAYHLREFSEQEHALKATTVASWEDLQSDELAALFAEYLYRIRRWALGYSARYFGKQDVALFKGVNIDQVARYPYVEPLRIVHHYVDDYNSQYHRKIDEQFKPFPFHLDQMIINGRRFFEMTAYYQKQVKAVVSAEHGSSNQFLGTELSEQAQQIFKILNGYSAKHRTGDKYIRVMFDCALVFYWDKFGSAELSKAVEKLFIWAYSLRIKQQVVQLATMDNYVLEKNLFRRVKDATSPSEVLNLPLATLSDAENKNNQRKNNAAKDPLVKLFKAMSYYE